MTIRIRTVFSFCGGFSNLWRRKSKVKESSKKEKKKKHLHIAFMNSCNFGSFLFSPRCQCPAQFEGPECQQNKHSFHGNGYAWFPPIMPCFESHVSLEFITDMADGLLLYSGPLAQLQAWDHEDFMAVGRNISRLMDQMASPVTDLCLYQNSTILKEAEEGEFRETVFPLTVSPATVHILLIYLAF